MRKVIVLEFITLDGVIQAGGAPEEDTSGGFAYGGWQAPYSDDVLGEAVMKRQMNLPFDLLLGRTTFEIWAPFWPQHADEWPGVMSATKYVASNTMTSSEWQPSRVFRRRHCGKSQPTQANARAGFARVWKCQSRSDAHEA